MPGFVPAFFVSNNLRSFETSALFGSASVTHLRAIQSQAHLKHSLQTSASEDARLRISAFPVVAP